MLHADLILYNANIHTMNNKKPKAQAIAIKNSKIVAIGSDTEILKLKNNKTKAIDLDGKTALPGFVDCHVHMGTYARTLEEIGLRDITSMKQLLQKLNQAEEQEPPGVWIVARGFDQEKFQEKRVPNRFDLDKAVSNHPLLITRVCGHLNVANSKALSLAGITKHTKLSGGGKIEKDPKTGEPTGVLLENAVNLVTRVMHKPSDEELLRIYSNAFQKATEKGLTSIHCMIENLTEIRIIQELRRQNKLKIRIHIMIPIEHFDELVESGISTHFNDDRVKIGCIKVFADGSLGAHTAALHEPYTDDKTTRGILTYSPEKLEALFEKVHSTGFQLAVHAIGDLAIEASLGVLEKVLKKKPKKDHCHRIEHASVLNEGLIERMCRFGVIASVQPHFVVSDFWIVKRLGRRRARWTYPFKSLVKSGVVTCAGSDCPIEPIDPLLGVWAAVARKTFPRERLSVDEAIRMYTVNAAFASREEMITGSIKLGKLADLTILSEDPYRVEPDSIRNISVEMTIIDGEIVYARKC